MGKLFCILGKSASGKDRFYNDLMADPDLRLFSVVTYTTRPMREGEVDGETYNFTDEEGFRALKEAGRIIEDRCYQTVMGPWRYFTADDGQIDFEKGNSLTIVTLEAYDKIKEYFGGDKVLPIYIEVEDGERLIRAIRREQQQKKPAYEEMCRRFLADAKDFSEERLLASGIKKRYDNIDYDICYKAIKQDILEHM
ncbi:MAG: guanylate kinase [Lachnospiraceae bacterium]|nr:guanylate kinase [Lachnospiraceae bacterium]